MDKESEVAAVEERGEAGEESNEDKTPAMEKETVVVAADTEEAKDKEDDEVANNVDASEPQQTDKDDDSEQTKVDNAHQADAQLNSESKETPTKEEENEATEWKVRFDVSNESTETAESQVVPAAAAPSDADPETGSTPKQPIPSEKAACK